MFHTSCGLDSVVCAIKSFPTGRCFLRLCRLWGLSEKACCFLFLLPRALFWKVSNTSALLHPVLHYTLAQPAVFPRGVRPSLGLQPPRKLWSFPFPQIPPNQLCHVRFCSTQTCCQRACCPGLASCTCLSSVFDPRTSLPWITYRTC
jgi:hypothetical protein